MIHFAKLRWDRIIMKCAWRCSSSHSITSTFRRGDHVSGKLRKPLQSWWWVLGSCWLLPVVVFRDLDEEDERLQRQVTTANSFRNQTSVSGVQVPALWIQLTKSSCTPTDVWFTSLSPSQDRHAIPEPEEQNRIQVPVLRRRKRLVIEKNMTNNNRLSLCPLPKDRS